MEMIDEVMNPDPSPFWLKVPNALGSGNLKTPTHPQPLTTSHTTQEDGAAGHLEQAQDGHGLRESIEVKKIHQ